MPRTYAGDTPACPPLRALIFDSLGLIKVIEVNHEKKVPEVVSTWGKPDSQNSVLASSFCNDVENPVIGVARKSRVVDIVSPKNGSLLFTSSLTSADFSSDGTLDSDSPIVGLHVFGKSRSKSFLACTDKGNTTIKSFQNGDSLSSSDFPTKWRISNSGSVLCCQVDGTEKVAAFGGKGIEVNTWDIEKCTKLWVAKAPRPDNMGLWPPAFVTALTFLNKDDPRKIVTGTGQHQVRLYDTAAQRRHVCSFDFKDAPIKYLKEDLDGYTVYVGNGTGDLASFDTRTGRSLGAFKGKCSGSIRSIAKHPYMPLLATCGLDRYLRLWDTSTRQILAAVFLKQQLTSVIFDANSLARSSTVFPDQSCERINSMVQVDCVEPRQSSAGKKRKSVKKTVKIKTGKSSKKLKLDEDDDEKAE